MEHICKTGESSLGELDTLRESMPPVWIFIYCLEGSADISLSSRVYRLTQGCGTIITIDMFPAVSSRTADFRSFYLIIDRSLAEDASYNVPNAFFDSIYIEPVLQMGEMAQPWIQVIKSVTERDAGYRDEIVSSLIRGLILDYFSRWEMVYGKSRMGTERSPAEKMCSKFYNLVVDNFREHHDTAYYADRLNITPNYLAMLIRKICRESPKEAINRQLVLEIKYLLRTTTMSMEQVSHRLHFNNASYMCRFFRKQTGISLSEFRKQQ